VSGLVAFGYKSPINNACMEAGDPCRSKRVAGNTAADISTVSFIAGGAAVAVGAVLFFTTSGNKAAPRTGALSAHELEVSPSVGWGTVGLAGRF
jgi:hypothetical protein